MKKNARENPLPPPEPKDENEEPKKPLTKEERDEIKNKIMNDPEFINNAMSDHQEKQARERVEREQQRMRWRLKTCNNSS